MTVHNHSLMAYWEILPTVGGAQDKVYQAIKKLGRASDKQIAKELGWEINRVTPRRQELAERRGVIEHAGEIRNDKNRLVDTWRIKNLDK